MDGRVTWRPATSSQKSAFLRFGDKWEMVPGGGTQTFGGVVCRFIRPVGFPNEARWVNASSIVSLPSQPE